MNRMNSATHHGIAEPGEFGPDPNSETKKQANTQEKFRSRKYKSPTERVAAQ